MSVQAPPGSGVPPAVGADPVWAAGTRQGRGAGGPRRNCPLHGTHCAWQVGLLVDIFFDISLNLIYM